MECPNFPLPGSDSCRPPSQSPATCCDMGQRRRIWESRQHAFSCLPCASLQPLVWPLASGPRLEGRTQGAAIAASSCVVEHGEVGEKERENASENLLFCYYSFLTCLWLPISLLLLSVSFDACCCLFYKHLDFYFFFLYLRLLKYSPFLQSVALALLWNKIRLNRKVLLGVQSRIKQL